MTSATMSLMWLARKKENVLSDLVLLCSLLDRKESSLYRRIAVLIQSMEKAELSAFVNTDNFLETRSTHL